MSYEDTAERQIERLHDRVAALEAMLQDVVMDLENEIDGRYSATQIGDHPIIDRRYDRDIEPCRRARKLLAERCSQGAR